MRGLHISRQFFEGELKVFLCNFLYRIITVGNEIEKYKEEQTRLLENKNLLRTELLAYKKRCGELMISGENEKIELQAVIEKQKNELKMRDERENKLNVEVRGFFLLFQHEKLKKKSNLLFANSLMLFVGNYKPSKMNATKLILNLPKAKWNSVKTKSVWRRCR